MLAIEEQLRRYGDAVEESLLGSFDDHPATEVRTSDHGERPPVSRRSRRLLYLAGAAVAASIVATIVVVATPSTDGVVSTPADTVPESAAVPVLTFGQPQGQVWRVPLANPTDHIAAEFRRSDRPTESTIQILMTHRPDGPTTTRRSGDREFLSSATPNDPMTVPLPLMWREADGTYWTLYRSIGSLPPQPELDQFFDGLRYRDGAFTASPPFEAYTSWTSSPVEWAIQDDVAMIAAYRNTDFEATDLNSPQSTVRGHPAVFDEGGGLMWREDAQTVITLGRRFSTGDQGTFEPLAESDALRIANGLVPSSRAALESLPIDRGVLMGVAPDQQQIIVQAPSGAVLLETKEILEGEPTTGGADGSLALGEDGVALRIRPEVIGFYIWIDAPGSGSSALPACAQRIDVPPPNEQPLFITVDPTCTG